MTRLSDWQVEALDEERREKEFLREIAEEELESNKKRRRSLRMRAMRRYSPLRYYDMYYVCVD